MSVIILHGMFKRYQVDIMSASEEKKIVAGLVRLINSNL